LVALGSSGVDTSRGGWCQGFRGVGKGASGRWWRAGGCEGAVDTCVVVERVRMEENELRGCERERREGGVDSARVRGSESGGVGGFRP